MDNCIFSTKKLLDLIGVKYTNPYLEEQILSHPDHPSLLAISDTLNKYNIENLAVKVDYDKLLELPLPCIVQFTDGGGTFQILTRLSEDNAAFINDANRTVELSRNEFLDRWTGICLLASTTEDSKEPGIEKRLKDKCVKSFLTWGTAVFLLIAMTPIIINSPLFGSDFPNPFLGAYVLIKLMGLAIGAMLLWYEVDRYNPTLQNFCSGGGKTDCNAVLGSKYAKMLNGRLSIALLAFAYFSGTLSYLMITGFSAGSLPPLALLSFATFPAILASAYYQGIVIKQWCRFCIVVQGVLVLEIICSIFGGFYGMAITWETLPLLTALLLFPVAAWKWLTPLLENKKETALYRRGLKKIKNNPHVLNGLLAKSRKLGASTEGLGISINGNGAKYSIIKVCNPYCGPCAQAHPFLEELVEMGRIDLQILFTAHADDNDIKRRPVGHFLALDAQGDKNRLRQALDDWYHTENVDYTSFANKYPLDWDLQAQDAKIMAMRQWCDAEKITHTPTIFINGHELPQEYSVEDLKEALV